MIYHDARHAYRIGGRFVYDRLFYESVIAKTMQCAIYKSSKKDEMYLYVPLKPVAAGQHKDEVDPGDLSQVPEVLMQPFGRPIFVMELELNPGRRLARVDAAEVVEKLQQDGFFLQMPPEKQNLLETLKKPE